MHLPLLLGNEWLIWVWRQWKLQYIHLFIWLINLATHCKHATGHSPSSPQTNQWLFHVASLFLFTLVCTKNQEELSVNSQGNKRWKEISWQEMVTSSIFLIQFGVLFRVLLALEWRYIGDTWDNFCLIELIDHLFPSNFSPNISRLIWTSQHVASNTNGYHQIYSRDSPSSAMGRPELITSQSQL